MAAKHFIIYYQRGAGTYVVTPHKAKSAAHTLLF
jgi:hypothetical protein